MPVDSPSPSAKRKGTFKCSICGRQFIMNAHLMRHMTATHDKTASKKPGGAKRGPGRPPGSRNKAKAPAATAMPAVDSGISGLSLKQLARLRQSIDNEIVGRLVSGQAVAS